MLAFFIIAVTLQYNDPDPIVWMMLYGFSAVATALLIFSISLWKYISTIPILISVFELGYYVQAILNSVNTVRRQHE